MAQNRKKIDFDAAIIGSGPAGMFSALELTRLCPDLKIAIFEKGPLREERTEDNVTSGWGGAGAFSDGKLTLSSEIGGQLCPIVGENKFQELMECVNRVFTDFGGEQAVFESSEEKINALAEKALTIEGLRLVPTKVRHFGSDRAPKIVRLIKEELEKRGVEIFLETPVKSIKKEERAFLLKAAGRGSGVYKSRYVVAAPGRDGAEWFTEAANSLSLNFLQQPIFDIGFRVEVPSAVLKPITDYLYDPKFIIEETKCTGDKVRTFCTCPRGHVILEKYKGILTAVNGHSFEQDESKKSSNTNFAVLVSVKFTEPFKNPVEFGKHIATLANRLSGKVIVQRLGDLTSFPERRSTPARIDRSRPIIVPTLPEAVPGDIGFALPYRFMRSALEMLEKLDKMAPGVWNSHTLLYFPEVKFYSNRIETSEDLETAIEGLFAVGDGAGISRGIMQASVSGIVAARAIAKKEKQ